MEKNDIEMYRVEQHRIDRHDRHDRRWAVIDVAAFASKNLYNVAMFTVRQVFFGSGGQVLLSYETLADELKTHDAYHALPAKVAQGVLKQVAAAWQSYTQLCRLWQAHSEQLQGKPRLPRYLDKQKGRNLLVYTAQAVSRPALQKGYIQPSRLSISIHSHHTATLQQVRIVYRPTHYVVEVVYKQTPSPKPLNREYVAGVDVGIDTLAAIASNRPGFVPLLVNGRPLKALNQRYNQRKAHLQREIAPRYQSRRLDELSDKRYRRVQYLLHVAARRIIDHLVEARIGTLVIGKNDGWKQGINLGTRTNQSFTHIPHARFIQMLQYKAEMIGMNVILTEESYTSKCSFLDNEQLGCQFAYQGKREHRGLFRAANGKTLHADINAAFNIIRKVIPDAFSRGIGDVVVHPVRVTCG